MRARRPRRSRPRAVEPRRPARRSREAAEQPRRARPAVQGGEGAARRGVRARLPHRAARPPPRQHLARRRPRPASIATTSIASSRSTASKSTGREAVALALALAARRVQGQASGTRSPDRAGSHVRRRRMRRDRRAARLRRRALRAARRLRPTRAAAHPDRRLQGHVATGRRSSPGTRRRQDGGPTRVADRAGDGRLPRVVRCRTRSSGSSAHSTPPAARETRTPWRKLARDVQAVSATSRRAGSSAVRYFALDRIARALGAKADPRRLPLPPVSPSGVGPVLADVDAVTAGGRRRSQITVLGDKVFVGRMPRAQHRAAARSRSTLARTAIPAPRRRREAPGCPEGGDRRRCDRDDHAARAASRCRHRGSCRSWPRQRRSRRSTSRPTPPGLPKAGRCAGAIGVQLSASRAADAR